MADRQSFRVSSFNLENLNRPGVFFFGRDKDAPYDDDLFRRKSEWIGSLMDAARTDIVGFQEVFSLEALEQAVAKSKVMAGAAVLSPETANRRNEEEIAPGKLAAKGPHVGLASLFPVLASDSIVDFPASVDLRVPIGNAGAVEAIVPLPIRRFERPLLKARIELPGSIPATVLVAHLKSKRGKFLDGEDARDPVVKAQAAVRSLIVRAAEAVALRAIVVGLIDDTTDERGEPLILLGDLNDDLPSVTTQTIAGEEPPFYWRKELKKPVWDTLLYSAHDIQEAQSYRDVSYSHIFNGRFELLDHIFVSQEFVRQFGGRVGQVLNTRIFNDHIRDERLEARRPPREVVIDGQRLRLPGERSDHGVPVTEIELNDAA